MLVYELIDICSEFRIFSFLYRFFCFTLYFYFAFCIKFFAIFQICCFFHKFHCIPLVPFFSVFFLCCSQTASEKSALLTRRGNWGVEKAARKEKECEWWWLLFISERLVHRNVGIRKAAINRVQFLKEKNTTDFAIFSFF